MGTSGTGTNGDEFSIQIISSSNHYYLRSGSLVVGTASIDFTVTTAEYTPDNFSFDSITNAEINQLYTSNVVTLA
ncbi:MAG: hypothetical protein WCL18_04905 [bacterium]